MSSPSETVRKQTPKQFKNGVSPLGNYLITGGPGRPKGSKSKQTRLKEALLAVRADIDLIPKDLQHDCMDYISKEEWLNTLRSCKKEETKIALIREWWDRRLPKIPVQVSMDSRSTQLTGTITDLLSILRAPVPQVGVIDAPECKDSASEAIDVSASNGQAIDNIDNDDKGTSD